MKYFKALNAEKRPWKRIELALTPHLGKSFNEYLAILGNIFFRI